MLISLNWLRDHIELGDLAPAGLAERLTLAGLEACPEAFGVVVGELREVSKHPDADKLVVCRVFDGVGERTVVCGAPNARAGMMTALVTPGVTLPGGTEVKPTAIRGVHSEGMLCSARELGLSDDHGGILELADDAVPGAAVHPSLAEWADVVLELDLTPNRPDCLSHIGVARELSAILGTPRKTPLAAAPESAKAGAAADAATVEIVDSDKGPRYAARIIEGVTIGPSPAWVARRLEAAGMRPINNVVDATNYVLLERGHPLHAFDLDRLAGHKIVVRRAGEGEHFTTLDGEERTLSADDLMIADGQRAVAIAGVMGGLDSEVTEKTTRLLLESAYFDPRSVRRTSKRHDLSSESARRFAGGADPEGVIPAVDACAALIAEWAGGSVRCGVIDVYPEPIATVETSIRVSRASLLLGVELTAEQVRGALEALEFEVSQASGDVLSVRVPSFRPDVTREVDLIEEVARIHGIDNVPACKPRSELSAPLVDPARVFENRLRDVLVAVGGRQTINYSFMPPGDIARLGLPDGHALADLVRASNPIKEEFSALRSTLLPGLLRNLETNVNQRADGVFLFEIGTVFADSPRDAENLPVEHRALAGLLWGRAAEARWFGKTREVDFFDAKGAIEALLDGAGIPGGAVTWTRKEHPGLNPHVAAALELGGREVGVLGELQPEVCEAFAVPWPVFTFEFDVALLAGARQAEARYQALPRYPGSRRDVAMIVGEDVAAGTTIRTAMESGARFVENVEIFDVYRGGSIPQGRKSLALAVGYRSSDGSLASEVIDMEHEKLVTALREKLEAEIRDS